MPFATDSPELPRRNRRGHGRPTLQDVADVAGVTNITVSRFLREPERVASTTAARIRNAIEQTGYVRNLQAGQLASGRSRIVAALIPNVGHSIFAETIQGLTEGLDGSGYELLLTSTGYSMEREEEQLRALLGWGLSALVLTGRQHSPGSIRLMAAAQAAGTVVIEIWDDQRARGPGPHFPQIGFDHRAVGRAMARHFIGQGHTELAYVDSAVAEDFRAHERGEGFAAEARKAGLSVRVVRAASGDVFDAGRQVIDQLASTTGRRITAVALANDHLACGLLLEAQARGQRLPHDLAVLGFGDFPLGRQMRPALSTVRPPRSEIGRATAAALLRAAEQGLPASGQSLPWDFVERESSMRPSS